MSEVASSGSPDGGNARITKKLPLVLADRKLKRSSSSEPLYEGVIGAGKMARSASAGAGATVHHPHPLAEEHHSPMPSPLVQSFSPLVQSSTSADWGREQERETSAGSSKSAGPEGGAVRESSRKPDAPAHLQ